MSNLITIEALTRFFPYNRARDVQTGAMEAIANSKNGVLCEMPTGSGKTGVGIAAIRAALAERRSGFYVTPTKVLTQQLIKEFPDVATVFGRDDYQCLYYADRGMPEVTAKDSPCISLDCEHRVHQETGETQEPGVEPCPYYQARFQALQTVDQPVVCTTAFFLLARTLLKEWREKSPGVVFVDEVHGLANVARSIFEHTITDYHLLRVADALRKISRDQAKILIKFVRKFRHLIMKRRRPGEVELRGGEKWLLKTEEIEALLAIVEEFDRGEMEKSIRRAVREGLIDPVTQRHDLKILENLVHRIPRLMQSLKYSLDDEEGDRRATNYVVAFSYREEEVVGTQRKARYVLTLKSYYVVPVIRKALGLKDSKVTVVPVSATIGDHNVLGWETGIRLPFHSFQSPFSSERTRLYVPTDCVDLSYKQRRRDDVKKTLRRIAEMSAEFATRGGHRSLVVVVSEEERQMFLKQAERSQLTVMSYGDGREARAALEAFKEGKGHVLVGTASQYGAGVDLPDGLAPVIFFLRPGYPSPKDPQAEFEKRRFGNQCWALWKWRVMVQALQVRGRNVRSEEDVGVCFFMSKQFKQFLYAGLPEWLRPAYRGGMSSVQAVEETLGLLPRPKLFVRRGLQVVP